MSTSFTQAQIGAVLALLHVVEMVRDADDDCKRDGLPTLPPAPRSAIDKALDQANKTLHPFTNAGEHGYAANLTGRDSNVVKDAQWVLSFLQRLEFQGSMAPAETMGRVLAHLQQSEPAPSLIALPVQGGIQHAACCARVSTLHLRYPQEPEPCDCGATT